MLRPSSFHGDIDGGVSQIHPVVGTVIRGLDDIRPMLRQNSRDLVQSARIVGKVHSQPYQASVLHQAAFDDPRQKGHIDISSTDHHRNVLAGQLHFVIDQRGETRRSRAFSERLFSLQQQQHSVRDFVSAAATELGMAVRWDGRGLDEKGYDGDGRCIVAVDPRYFRPTEVETLLGDATKARERLGWKPKASFAEIVKEMVAADMELARRELEYGGMLRKVVQGSSWIQE